MGLSIAKGQERTLHEDRWVLCCCCDKMPEERLKDAHFLLLSLRLQRMRRLHPHLGRVFYPHYDPSGNGLTDRPHSLVSMQPQPKHLYQQLGMSNASVCPNSSGENRVVKVP